MSVWFVTKGFCGLCAWASRGALMMAGAVLALEVPRVLETDASETVRVVTVDPYRNVDWAAAQHNKGNLHTHTTESDGQLQPSAVVDGYHQRGYRVLALTDHNRVTYPWTAFDLFSPSYTNRDPTALGMLAISGNELSRHHHVQSLFTDFASTGTVLDAVLEGLSQHASGARALLNHPAWHWTRTAFPKGFKVPLEPALRQVTQGDFTVEAWFRTSDTNRNVLLGNYSAAFRGALNLELHTDNRVRLYLQSVSSGTVDRNLSAGAINTRDGQWHHAAGVRREGKCYVYLDGQQLGAEANDTAGAFDLQGDDWWIGRDTRTGATEFNGDLDEVRLWARGLSSNEVARLASGEVPGDEVAAEGVLAAYAFDRPVQADDTAGHADGPFHASRVEPGYRVALAPALRQVTQGDFTVEAWFRTTDTARNILLGNYASASVSALNLELHTDNRLRLYLQPPAGQGSILSLFGTPAVNTRDGRWRHAAGIRRGGVAFLYLDGQEIARTNDTAGTFDLQEAYTYMGRDSRLGTTVFKGDLAPLRLWSRALTPEEVAQLAAGERTETGVSTTGLLARYALESATRARDTAGHAEGPFDGESAAFSGALRIYDVAPPLLSSGRSSSAISLDWTPPYPTSVPPEVIDTFAGVFERHAHLVGMEVLNGTMTTKEYPLDRELWDALLARLMPERPVWGVANDDMHSLAHLGRDWSVFLTADLNEDSVRRALDAGAFYFSSTRVRPVGGSDLVPPPRLERVSHDIGRGLLTLSATEAGAPLPESAYAWISLGKIVQIGPVFDYRAFNGTGTYVRAELTGTGGTTYTNPFGLSVMEKQADSDADGLPDWWELAYFHNTMSVGASTVSPSGMTAGEHYIAGSDPRDPGALFKVVEFRSEETEPNRMRLRWPSAAGRVYTIEQTPDLDNEFGILANAEALEAEPPYNEYDVPFSGPQAFYRIRVRLAE